MVSPLSDLALRACSAPSFPRRLVTYGGLARPWPSPCRPRRPRRATQQRRWSSSESPAAPHAPKDIAVLGGGLTGLTTAYYLTRFHPTAKITLYEGDNRLGGWLDTHKASGLPVGQEHVKSEDGQEPIIHMERGARTVAPQTRVTRWEDFVLYELLHDLDCAEDVYSIPKAHPALSKRYVYYPDHLVELPGSPPKLWKALYTVLTEPVLRGMIRSIWRWMRTEREHVSFTSRPGEQSYQNISIADLKDMSMGEFLLARTGSPDIVNNLASALMHGIWGGDIWKLSALDGTFQSLYLKHQLPLPAAVHARALVRYSDYFSGSDIMARTPQIGDLIAKYADSGYLGFRNGFNTLAQKLGRSLQNNPNVTVKLSNHVKHIQYDKEAKQTLVTTTSSETHGHDKVISSLYSGTLAKLTGDTLPALKGSAAVTIQIVNLWYENVQLDQVYPGFGYLIPQSVPAENNPHAALGVIFDSDRDAAAGIDNRPNRGTNLTVMLGGHYWDYVDPASWPSAEDAITMAKDTVQRQLGIPATEPTRASTKRCSNCIPQHLVGHRGRMAQTHKELSDAFAGTLAVVGGSYTMPGVLPSLQAARDVALAVSGGEYMVDPAIRGNGKGYQLKHVGQTGLGRFVDDNDTFGAVLRDQLPFRFSTGHTRFNSPVFRQ